MKVESNNHNPYIYLPYQQMLAMNNSPKNNICRKDNVPLRKIPTSKEFLGKIDVYV